MEKTVKIQVPLGLEARPIAMLVQIASQFDSTVYLQTAGKKVNAKSIMGMMSLSLRTGDEITVLAEGSDEDSAIQSMEDYLLNQSK